MNLPNTPEFHKILLETFGYTTIHQAKKDTRFKNKKAKEIYDILKIEFQNTLANTQQAIKKINEIKTHQRMKRTHQQTQRKMNQIQQQVTTAKAKVLTQDDKDINSKNRFYKNELQAFGGAFQQVNFQLNEDATADDIKVLAENTLLQKLQIKPLDRNLKVSLRVLYNKIKDDNDVIYKQVYSSDYAITIRTIKNIEEFVNEFINELLNHIEAHENGPSNMRFTAFIGLEVQFSYSPLSKVGSYIELPKEIANKKCCVNIKNTDDKCIMWCYLAFKHYEDVKDRNLKNLPKGYEKWLNEWIINDLNYPIDIDKDIPKIEKTLIIKINVFGYDAKPFTIYNDNTKQADENNILDLLLLSKEGKQHFVLIKNFTRFIGCSGKEKSYCCRNCLQFHTLDKQIYENHYKCCIENIAIRCILPTDEQRHMRFKNFNHTFKHPFFIVYDFESTLKPYEDMTDGDTKKYQEHIPNSYAIKFNCIYPEIRDTRIIIRNNSNQDELMKAFIEDLERLTNYAYKLTKRYKKFNSTLTPEQDQYNKSSTFCKMCNEDYTTDNKKVLHHNHITGEYLDTICSNCNLKLKQRNFIPIIAHNSKNYDAHFIVPYLYKYGQQTKNISCIPTNEERYISFSKKLEVNSYMKDDKTIHLHFEMRFLDSFSFLSTSLQSLVENLKPSGAKVCDLRKVFPNISNHFKDNNHFHLMLQKGIYPYDYITDFDKLYETELPSEKCFYSKLNENDVTKDDYKQAKRVFKTLQCKNLLDYHNYYLTCDVLLLSDVWLNFCKTSNQIYGLDPNYYYTSPALSWDAMMKFNYETYGRDWSIELITDMNIYLMFERGIRGGLSQISTRYAKANNPLSKHYNPAEPESYISYFDANNLYGAGMSSYLPYKDFQWNKEEWTAERILQLEDKAETGYLFEVDLHYPSHLHKLHNGYALCSENKIITNDMLNDFQAKNRKETKTKKLICSFEDKTKYVLNYRYLKFVLQQGLQLVKVHRVLEYQQSNFMAGYIQKNTTERMKAKSDFEKDFYKLMNNSVYGKTMENVRNRINYKLISSEAEILRLRNIPKRFTYFTENLLGVHLLKKEIILNKPIFIGQNVLDESKVVMYDFYYNFIMKKFNPENVKLLMTDTDSLVLHIQNENPYEIMKQNREYFDLSDFPKDSDLYDPTNKKVIGKFKDEVGMNFIQEFCGLRPKMYSYTLEDFKECLKAKGVKKSTANKYLTFLRYKNMLRVIDMDTIVKNGSVTQNIIRSYKHKLFSESVTKVALNPLDDKVYICDDGINTLTFVSCFIPVADHCLPK